MGARWDAMAIFRHFDLWGKNRYNKKNLAVILVASQDN
jgi:hypothetical protein